MKDLKNKIINKIKERSKNIIINKIKNRIKNKI